MDLRLIAQGPALRLIFFGHLIPTIWALQKEGLCPQSYLLYNFLFFVGILWCLHSQESEEAILMTTFMDLLYILMDAITIGTATSNNKQGFSFSALMLIINLLLRPISSLILLRFYNERSGRYNSFGIPGFQNYGAGGQGSGGPSASSSGLGRNAYEDIDSRTYHQTVPTPLVDTGSPVKEPTFYSK